MRKTAPRTPILRVIDLRHSYKTRQALHGITFDVKEGEVFGILGPNGSGKSTLFNILSTLLVPSAGDATLAGQSILTSTSKVRQRLGVVFQSYGLDKKLTLFENLMHQGHLHAMQGELLERRIVDLLAEFGLSDRRDDLVEHLSGGFQRRVEIMKSLLHTPQVLLLDEPSTGLDPGARLDLWHYLKYCREEKNTTILLTTHLIDEADQCDRVAIFDKGNVVALGTPDDLKSALAGDIITIQGRHMNQLSGKIRRQFNVETHVLDEELFIETKDAHRFIPKLAQRYGAFISSLTLRKPTLEDVFINKTGHRFVESGMGEGSQR